MDTVRKNEGVGCLSFVSSQCITQWVKASQKAVPSLAICAALCKVKNNTLLKFSVCVLMDFLSHIFIKGT